jgi:hypothetical protein
VKALWIGRAILRLRFKAVAAWHLFWGQPGQATRLALQARAIAEATSAVADTLESLEQIFGMFLRPGPRTRRAQA